MKHAVVWFKRDLRIYDHEPLAAAARHGPLTCVYFIEPQLWHAPDAATQHYHFILESLKDLRQALGTLGLDLNILVGCATDGLDRLWQAKPFDRLYAHQETGNALSYERDKAVGRWCQQRGVVWQQFQQFGVHRGRHNRDHWKQAWQTHCGARLIGAPSVIESSGVAIKESVPDARALGLDQPDVPRRQRGGRTNAIETFNEFLETRSQQYRGSISSPLSAPTACSRISTYLAYGCLSIREVYQATQAKILEQPSLSSRHAMGLQSFVSRLYWHCHFIQKLEDEPELEYRNLHRGYDGLRENDWSQERFTLLTEGQTGWPMVDACVAMLRQTGWLNFRMRAMLVSVAAYPLWLHWREVGHWLARQFLDYEPGIHWSQMQMQSGTTGINLPRIYNPIKQARDHDPQGRFVRQWLPAMRRVPNAWLLEPWLMPPNLQRTHGVMVGQDIAAPMVDLATATRQAKSKVFALRAQAHIKDARAPIVKKHGSRKNLESSKPRRQSRSSKTTSQLSLDF
jgi:deoxyribodipyrimidine photo-lyase